MFYSKKTGGFYDSDIHRGRVPDDAVELTAEQYSQLLISQSQGFSITADAKGWPIATAQPVASVVELKAAAIDKVRAERKLIMGMLDGMQASALSKTDAPRAGVIEAAKQGLRDLTKIDTATCVTAADFKALFLGRYKVIAGALPADVRLAFAEALL